MNPEISIIVPVYNVENYLKRCINSILNQSFTNFELILVNDGSTDSSGKIIDEYKRKDKRIKVIHKENGGQGSARNRGLDIAKGNYIGFVDSDDWIHKDMYKILYENCKKNDAEIVQIKHINCTQKKEDKLIKDIIEIRKIKDIFSKISMCNSFEILPFIFVWNKLYKKELWENMRFDEDKFAEDIRIIYKIYNKIDLMLEVNSELYYYFLSPNSSTRSEFNIKKLEDVEAWEELLQFYKENYPHLDRTNLNMLYCRRIRRYYFNINGNKKFKIEQDELYKKFRKYFIYCVKTKKHNWKEKSVDILFFISPKLCKYIFEKRNLL